MAASLKARPIRLGRLVKSLRRDPRAFLERVFSNRTRLVVSAAHLAPAGVRRPVARAISAAAEGLAVRGIAAPRMASLAFIATWTTGHTDAAREVARRIAFDRRIRPQARARLARHALEAGLRDLAAEIIDTIADERIGSALAVRARYAQAMGHYGEAVRLAREAEAMGATDAGRVAERASGIIAALQPTWRPAAGDAMGRLAGLRGSVQRGRILHLLHSSLPHRGSGYAVRSHAVGLCQRAAGLDPHFATRAGFPRSDGVVLRVNLETLDGIPYHRLAPQLRPEGNLDLAMRETARTLIPLIERLRPAALQPASNHMHAQVALALAEPMGVPVVYEVRGFWEETWAANPWHDEAEAQATDHYRMSREVETWAMQRAARVVTLSETMREEIVARGCAPERVTVIPNAVDVKRFEPRPRDAELAASFGIEPDEPVVGYISSFSPYEGISYLLRAAAMLRDRGRRLRVLLVGDGKEEAAIRALARDLQLDRGTLIMPGRVQHSEVPRYYSLIDIFVVPRTDDRVSRLVTPLKPFEAMAMQCAVVVSDLPALREIVSPGETGMTFRAEDERHLAEILEELLADPARRSRLGEQARQWVLANRTWAANGRRYRELYEELGAA
jgi:glycosyltransferase involved in cell wall biosynthesis